MAKIIAFPVINLPATGRSIELHRKAAKLSVRDIQTYFGFEYPQAVYKWQRGECLPSVDNLLALARLLEVSMEDLLVYEDQEVPLFLERLWRDFIEQSFRKNSFGENFAVHNAARLFLWSVFFPKKNKSLRLAAMRQ